MATIALTRPVHSHRSSAGIGSLAPGISLDTDSLSSEQPHRQPSLAPPVPNKHIPVCPPGPPPTIARALSSTQTPDDYQQESLLYPPPTNCSQSEKDGLVLYSIDAAGVAAALDHVSRQPLPDPSLVFPWFHGLHPGNQLQQAFFAQQRRSLHETPCCLRGVTIVKADGDLQNARLKGAIAPEEFMQSGSVAEFIEADPREGFSVRNFQIQSAKTAMTSDIIVYGDDHATVEHLAWDIAAAQQRWRDLHHLDGSPLPVYNTFICRSAFAVFEEHYPEIVATSADGQLTGNVIDFFHQERKEMYAMTRASEISHNVWLGPTPDPAMNDGDGNNVDGDYDILIECSDLGHLNPRVMASLLDVDMLPGQKVHLDFPSSGTILPPTWSQGEADDILESCKYLYHLAHGTALDDAPKFTPRKILIHCADGYTESTLLGIAYFSYSTGRPVPDAWLSLHTTMGRNFFAYPTDVALLTALSPRLLAESPVCPNKDPAVIKKTVQNEPRWFPALDGSFPSRVLDYMYLGNLNHANNPDLLKALGITQILSVGEMAMWRDGELDEWGRDNVCTVEGVQDNGIDPLTEEFGRCLEFIDRGRREGTATLVHCRVGVSRSATICIAEVMRAKKLSFPRAYCFVRARRLNVIIQPHLRFAYELLKWEEMLQQGDASDLGSRPAGSPRITKRELEWGEIAREVALMNQPYVR